MTLSVEVDFNETTLNSLKNLQVKNLENLEKLKEQSEDPSEENSLWYQWPENEGKKLCQDLEGISSKLPYFYNLVIVIGVGGSYTGTKTVDDLFGTTVAAKENSAHLKPMLFCGYHLSESYLQRQLKIIDQHKPVICVVSKSGKTLEPNAIYSILSNHLKTRFTEEEVEERTFFITSEKESPLLKNSPSNKAHCFSIPAGIVGRFSVLSAASLAPLALAGHNIKALMRGADDFFHQLESKEPS